MNPTTIELVREMFQLEQQARSARMLDDGRPIGPFKKRYEEIQSVLRTRTKEPPNADLNVEHLVREYIANEILREVSAESSVNMAVRVLGEVLANKPGMAELVIQLAAKIAREILPPKVS